VRVLKVLILFFWLYNFHWINLASHHRKLNNNNTVRASIPDIAASFHRIGDAWGRKQTLYSISRVFGVPSQTFHDVHFFQPIL
jgi:hypothetical protein